MAVLCEGEGECRGNRTWVRERAVVFVLLLHRKKSGYSVELMTSELNHRREYLKKN